MLKTPIRMTTLGRALGVLGSLALGALLAAQVVVTPPATSSGGGGGTSDHAALTNLAYASAGHTGFVPDTRTVAGHALSSNVTVSASDVGLGSVENAAASGLYVPLTRTVNGSALSSNVTISTITGNAGTATALQTARAINGVAFDGTAAITVTAAAGTLSGATLASGVTASSLTSFGSSPTLTTPTIASFANAAHTHADAAGGGTLNASAIAAGTLSVARGGTGIATITSNALVKGAGASAMVVSGCTIDSSDNLTCPGSVVSGSGSGVGGTLDLTQGTLPSSFPANSFSLYAPTSISTSYQWRLPTADAAGAIVSSGAGTPGVLSIVGFSGTGNIAKVSSPTFVTPTLGAPTATGTITSTIGTVTVDTQPLTITETRNASGVAFRGITYSVTNTAAAAGSTLIDLQTGSAATRLTFYPNPAGYSVAENAGLLYAGIFQSARIGIAGDSTVNALVMSSASGLKWASGGAVKYDSGLIDTGMHRSLAGLAEINNGTLGTYRDLKARMYVTTVGANLASAATIAPIAGITHVTGTVTVSTITVPTNLAQTGAGGCVTLIPDGVFATDTGGNIAIASTSVVGKALIMCFDNGTSKWYPSY